MKAQAMDRNSTPSSRVSTRRGREGGRAARARHGVGPVRASVAPRSALVEGLERFERGCMGSFDWVQARLQDIHRAEASANRAVDTARVKAHLAVMDVEEFVNGLPPRLDRARGRIDRLVTQSAAKSAEGLGKFTDACQRLKKRLGA